MLAIGALVVSACGSTSSGATTPRPAAPSNLTVYIDNSGVSVSPASVGAGAVTFIITNQATQTESLSIAPTGGGNPLANTGPINPQATAQVTVDFSKQGGYSLSTGDAGSGSSGKPATIHVGSPTSSSDNQLLQP